MTTGGENSIGPMWTRDGIVIDGSTQAASTGETNPLGPEVVLSGAGAGPSTSGLRLFANNSRIHELNIHSFPGNGIEIYGNGNRIAGSYIGTDPMGVVDGYRHRDRQARLWLGHPCEPCDVGHRHRR